MNYFKFFLEKLKQINKGEAAIALGTSLAKDVLTGGTGVTATADTAENTVGWLVQKHREFRQNKEVDNLYAFIHGATNRENEFGVNFSLENFEKLINKIIQEDNESKSGYYVNLAIKLSNRVDINTSDKNNYINLLSQLSYEELIIINRFYISYKYDIKGYNTKQEQEGNIPFNQDRFFPLYYSKLAGMGLLNSGGALESGSRVTKLLIEFSELIFDNEHLKPQSIGKECKNKVDLLIVLRNELLFKKTIIEDIKNSLEDRHKLKIIALMDIDNWWLDNSTQLFLAIRKILNGQELFEIALFDNIDYIRKWYSNDDVIHKAISSMTVSTDYYISEYHEHSTEIHVENKILLEYMDCIKNSISEKL